MAERAPRRTWRSALAKLAVVAALLAAWELSVRAFAVSPLLVPPASQVLVALFESLKSLELPGYALQSFKVLLPGLLIGTGFGLLLALIGSSSTFGRLVFETLITLFNPLPAIALLPLALLWFGLGQGALIFVVTHAVLWPMAVSTSAGLRAVPLNLERLGRNLGLSRPRLAATILFPAALPHVVAGLRNGWAFAWRTVIAAELVFGVAARQGGLGWFIYRHRFEMDTDLVFAGLLMIVLIGLLVETVIFYALERLTVVRWGMST